MLAHTTRSALLEHRSYLDPLPTTRGATMSDHVYRKTEIVGTSTTGLDDAIRNGIKRASSTLRGLDWFEVTEIRGHIEGDAVAHYQVTLKVGFRLEEPN